VAIRVEALPRRIEADEPPLGLELGDQAPFYEADAFVEIVVLAGRFGRLDGPFEIVDDRDQVEQQA
jgi:hypothetical protein